MDDKQKNTAVEVSRSEEAFEDAQRVLAGGVNSPVRAFGAVGGTPRFIAKAAGAVMTDLDGADYIDYVGSWGPMILGHADKRVKAAAGKVLDRGWSYGTPTLAETRLAEMILADYASIDKIRFVNSGTEATMSAIRLARGFTGRQAIIKCEGCYHGHADALLVKAGSGLATFGTPSSDGVPSEMTSATIVAPYNNLDAAKEIFAQRGSEIAAYLVEPIAGNMGCVPPADGYLQGLRDLCDANGALLIFDEVMTGYRVGLAGAQGRYGVHPDLTCLGKIVGGGMPVGAYGGRSEIMDKLSPTGPVYQAGTLSGNPLAMAAGLATIEALHDEGVYERLEDAGKRLEAGWRVAAQEAGVPTYQTRVGSMLGLFFQSGPVTDYTSAARSDTQAYATFFHEMLKRGVYLAPSQFEAAFISLAHTDALIDQTIEAARESFQVMAEK